MIHLKMNSARIAFVTLLISAAPTMHADEIPWQKDFAQARRQAAEQGKPMLIHFWSESCGPCKKLDRYVFPHPEVARTVNAVVPVKINTREQRRLAAQFGIKRIPTDVLIAPDGRELWRGISPSTVGEYIGMVNRAVRRQQIAPEASGLSQLADAARNRSSQLIGQAGYASHAVADRREDAIAAGNRPRTSPPAGVAANDAMLAQNRSAQAASGGAFQPNGNSYHLSDADPRARQAPGSGANQFRPAANTPIAQGPVSGAAPAGTQPDANPYFDRAAATKRPQPDAAFTPSASPQVQPSTSQPRFALEGYCPVSLVDQHRWIKGDRRWGVVHRGQTYLFSSEENLKRFWSEPDGFSPMLSGYDPVRFADQRQWIEGRRQHGVFYKDQTNGRTSIVLFADEATLEQFCRAPEKYRGRVQQALQAGRQSTYR